MFTAYFGQKISYPIRVAYDGDKLEYYFFCFSDSA